MPVATTTTTTTDIAAHRQPLSHVAPRGHSNPPDYKYVFFSLFKID